MTRAAATYEAARAEAETHEIAGERATSQAQRAFVLAFTHPAHADDEIDLATQLLTGLDLRATTLTVQIASPYETPAARTAWRTASTPSVPRSTPLALSPRRCPSSWPRASTTPSSAPTPT
ncbi:hypothetical protein ACIBKZ_31400 [Streptomyces sp. NPDC050421]|uniref:hypothetical protein n=1 Tax=Streptomyces sp. NPDC050421 TaxID=3365613 RepID=UPI0037AB498E